MPKAGANLADGVNIRIAGLVHEGSTTRSSEFIIRRMAPAVGKSQKIRNNGRYIGGKAHNPSRWTYANHVNITMAQYLYAV